MDETFHLNWSFIALREKTTTILGRIKFAHTTTFNISVHHFWADAIWSTFTRSMSAKVVLHRRKMYIIIIIAWWEKVEIIWLGFDIVNVSGVDVTPGDERFTITKNWIFG